MAGIQNINVVDDATGSDFNDGLPIFSSDGAYLVSVIATNTTDTDAEIYVWTQPNGWTSESEFALIAYKLPLPAYNSYETFRFGVNSIDTVYVAGSAGVRYFLQGLEQIG